ncbi:MAG: excinuclease ABC subunit UvrA, partial [Candidatus Aenigmarchaeota archaeon]|nr:excinuclease ABC subunit UvrA [Candidatus Aenigmarchaeota archaeon]
ISPRSFSFNSPHGACPACTGLGTKLEIDPDLVMPNPKLTLAEGAVRPWSRTTSKMGWYLRLLEAVGEKYGFSINTPVGELSKKARHIVFYGTGDETIKVEGSRFGGGDFITTYEGVIPNLERRYKETDSDYIRKEIEKYMRVRLCPKCEGKRLKPEVLAVTIAKKSIYDITTLSITRALEFFEKLTLTEREQIIARQILKEIKERLSFLLNVGLDYLTLDRTAATLSGGEAQRIRLAT